MLTSEQISDIIEWDISNWSHALHFWEKNLRLGSKESLNCLELGGNRGGPSLWLALNGHSVVCSDLENPEVHARKLHDKYNVENLVTYEAVNALEVPYKEQFDVVVFKSIIGGISRSGNDDRKKEIIDNCYNALKPGGILLFAENLEASFLHTFARKKFVKWGAEWNYLRYSELNPLLQRFSSSTFNTIGFFGAFGRSEKQRQLLSKIDHSIRFLIPKSKRYIVYGIAVK